MKYDVKRLIDNYLIVDKNFSATPKILKYYVVSEINSKLKQNDLLDNSEEETQRKKIYEEVARILRNGFDSGDYKLGKNFEIILPENRMKEAATNYLIDIEILNENGNLHKNYGGVE